MAKTGAHLKIIDMGDNVLGVRLFGDPKKPEPIHFRLRFPGGDVDLVRTTDNQYWVHVNVSHSDHPNRYPGDKLQDSRLANVRLDILNKATNEADLGSFNDPDLFHLALRIAPETNHEEEI